MKKWKQLIVLVAAGALILLLIGCGSSSAGGNNTQQSPSSSGEQSSSSSQSTSSTSSGTTSSGSSSYSGKFNVVGVWKVTDARASGVGQAQKGAIIKFTDQNQCNLISPSDTYVIEKRSASNEYLLSYTTVMGSSGGLVIKVIDSNKFEIYTGGERAATLTRTS